MLGEGAELQIGYLKADLAVILTDGIESSVYPYATVRDIAGGTRGKPSLGVALEVVLKAEPSRTYDAWLMHQRQLTISEDRAADDESKSTRTMVGVVPFEDEHSSSGNRRMVRYKNRSGNSGIAAFLIGADFVKLRFLSQSKIYVYTRDSVGPQHLKEMKRLATLGKGLSTYVNHHVHGRYDRIE